MGRRPFDLAWGKVAQAVAREKTPRVNPVLAALPPLA
jgi:hypothetical protein